MRNQATSQHRGASGGQNENLRLARPIPRPELGPGLMTKVKAK